MTGTAVFDDMKERGPIAVLGSGCMERVKWGWVRSLNRYARVNGYFYFFAQNKKQKRDFVKRKAGFFLCAQRN